MRLFVAFHLPAPMREAISLLRGSMPGVQWSPADSYHICLRFIGEVSNRHIMRDIDDALARLAWTPFDIVLEGAHLHKGQSRHALALGLAPSPALDTLQRQIESALRRAGIAPAKRRFQPHLTLGHFHADDPALAMRWLQAHNLFRSKPAALDHVTLFESLRGYEERVYVPQAEYSWSPSLSLSADDE